MDQAPGCNAAQQNPAPVDVPFPIVGIGASAGGVAALITFFTHQAPDSAMAFVVILHLPTDAESHLAAILQRHTPMPVVSVTAPVRLQPNQVYVLPPHAQLVIGDGMLGLATGEPTDGIHLPIDHCLRTLAEAYAHFTSAVILSGTGSDGAIGLGRIKEVGGVTLVQDPQDAEFASMPRAAIGTGLVDFVQPVAQLPDTLRTYWARGARLTATTVNAEPVGDDADLLRDLFALLRVRTGHDFSQYKRPTIARRLGRRLQVTGVPDLAAYLALLRRQPEEVQALLQDLLISVTNFFRDQDAWTTFGRVLPQLFATKGPDAAVRVWVAGCATGDEAYSVAMLLQEVADTLAHPPRLQVFASDIDDAALAVARQGLYPSTIAGDVNPARLGRFFVPDQGGYRITQEIRDLVLFARHNVLHDPPFSRLDAITCRNLLIYLNHDAQAHVLAAFHFGLRPNGYLLLGSAETVDGVQPLFARTAPAQRLFQRRPGPPLALNPLAGSAAPVPALPAAVLPTRAPNRPLTSFGALHTQLVAAYTPPSVIVDGDGTIVHLGRDVGGFLRFGEGAPSQNLLTVVQPDLRHALRTAFVTARHEGQPAEARGVPAMVAGAARLIDVIVQPLTEPDWAQGYLLVVLQDVGAAATPLAALPTAMTTLVAQLEAEVEQTRAQLRATVEQYEAVVEEHKAANEELQAINEELRAATEELETSKEELQSVNEELTTLNGELQHTVAEVRRAHNDLQNLIASTQIGTIFLDRELRVKRFTPAVQTIFNLLPADLGRPLVHVTHTLQDHGVTEDAAAVLHTLTPLTREVQTTTGQWFLLQLLPYRTLDDRIDGVVLTFVDITARKRVEDALAERARLLDLSNDAIIVRDVDNRITYWNHGATELYGWTRDEVLGQDMHTLLRTEFELPFADLIRTLHQQDRMEGEVVQVTRAGRRITVWSRWSLDRDRVGRPGAILTTYNDITVRKQAEADREQLLAVEQAGRAAVEAALFTRDQFLSIASHELRTPLTALLGYAHLLPQAITQGRGDPVIMATLIARQAARLDTLIDQLLDVSRLQQGQFAITQEPVDLATLVREVVAAFRATQPPDPRHSITVSDPDAPVMVVGDAQRLEQVLLNLLTNAVKYSPGGGPIRVQVSTTATEAVLEVADQGIGIPADAYARLREAFYRASNVSTQTSGFGLGLHIVDEIVQRHGGRIDIDSAEGVGSTFRVVLPLGNPAPGTV